MKILHVIPSVFAASGGPAEGLKQLCRIYRSGGHEIEVASLDAPTSVAELEFPAKVLGLGPRWGTYGYSTKATAWLEKHIANYDVVFLNGVWQYDTLAAYRALAKSSVPYAVYAHGMLDPYFRRRFPIKHIKKSIYWHLVLGRILRDARAVLFTSGEEEELAQRSFARYQVRGAVVPFGTYGPQCDLKSAMHAFHRRWPELDRKRVVLSMGRLHPKKGLDLLMRAFAEVFRGDEEWRLIIAGPDEMGHEAQLRKLADTLEIGSMVTWTGEVTGELKWGGFAAAEVFVLPSHQENFGIVVAEAMACSLPVIVSNKVAVWRQVAEHRAGLICDDTAEGVRECLARWAGMNVEERAAARTRSRKCFEACFDYEGMSDAVLEVVDRIASRARLPRWETNVPEGMVGRDS